MNLLTREGMSLKCLTLEYTERLVVVKASTAVAMLSPSILHLTEELVHEKDCVEEVTADRIAW